MIPRPDLASDSSPASMKSSTFTSDSLASVICTNTAINNTFHLNHTQVLNRKEVFKQETLTMLQSELGKLDNQGTKLKLHLLVCSRVLYHTVFFSR